MWSVSVMALPPTLLVKPEVKNHSILSSSISTQGFCLYYDRTCPLFITMASLLIARYRPHQRGYGEGPLNDLPACTLPIPIHAPSRTQGSFPPMPVRSCRLWGHPSVFLVWHTRPSLTRNSHPALPTHASAVPFFTHQPFYTFLTLLTPVIQQAHNCHVSSLA